MRLINKLFIHCSDTPNGRNDTEVDIKRWHTDPKPKGNGWKAIGYHYIILLNGDIKKGRPDEMAGAHCKGHNTDSLGICLIGRDKFTLQQWSSLFRLLLRLVNLHPDSDIVGHYEFDKKKTCPNIDMFALRDMIL